MGGAFSLLLSKFNCGRAACAISGPLRKRVSGSFRQPKETGLTLSHLCVLYGDLNQMEEDLVRGGPAGWTFASASSGMPGGFVLSLDFRILTGRSLSELFPSASP